MKHLKGQQFLFTMTYIESEVSLKILNHELSPLDLSLKFEAAFAVFAIFQDELQARISLKAFFLQLIGQLNYSSERFLSSCRQKMSKDFLSSVLGQIIVSNLTNVRKWRNDK